VAAAHTAATERRSYVSRSAPESVGACTTGMPACGQWQCSRRQRFGVHRQRSRSRLPPHRQRWCVQGSQADGLAGASVLRNHRRSVWLRLLFALLLLLLRPRWPSSTVTSLADQLAHQQPHGAGVLAQSASGTLDQAEEGPRRRRLSHTTPQSHPPAHTPHNHTLRGDGLPHPQQQIRPVCQVQRLGQPAAVGKPWKTTEKPSGVVQRAVGEAVGASCPR